MSPTHHRYVFIGFTLLIAGVAVNVMALQPEQPVSGVGRNVLGAKVDGKVDVDRRQWSALDRSLPQVTMPAQNTVKSPNTPTSPAVPEQFRPDLVKFDAVGAATGATEQSTVSSRVTTGGPPPPSAQASVVQPPMEQGPRRFARLRPDAAFANRPGDRFPDAPDAEGDPDTIKAVQRELSSHGYGQLNPDGVPGLVTRAAIMAFEFDQRMALTGEATERVLSRLLLGPTGAASADPAAGLVRSPQAEMVMRTAQQSLAALGYQVGRIDGKPGEEIARAIREFELDEGLKPTGRVSADIFNRLGRVVASAKPKPIQ